MLLRVNVKLVNIKPENIPKHICESKKSLKEVAIANHITSFRKNNVISSHSV